MLPFFNHAAVLFLLLLFYSFLGWCGEMIYCSIGQRKLCEKRGFLNGPLCPIYGHGALLVLLALGNRWNTPAATFLVGMVLTSAVEYITSYAMEKLFHMRWWDYSKRRFNLGGRVCLLNSSLFGLLSLALLYGIQPLLERLIALLPEEAVPVISTVLLLLFTADLTAAVMDSIQFKALLRRLRELGEELERRRGESGEPAEKLRLFLEGERQRLLRMKHAGRRLLRAFPEMSSVEFGDPLRRLRAFWKEHRPKPPKKGR